MEQHKINYQTLYTQEHINFLNTLGMLSISSVMRISKCDHPEALAILKEIAKDFMNVYFITKWNICVDGREPKHLLKKSVKVKSPSARKSKWKDIMKP